jgi:Holliday junction resolvase RusA-like endonuclease
MTIEIRLDGDPVGKGRPRFVRATGRTYTPEKTASFEARLGYAAQAVMRNKPLLAGPLIVTVMAFRSVPASWSEKKRQKAFLQYLTPTGRPDCDNYLKLCMDSLNKIVWEDDAQVVAAHVYKKYSERPRLEINISPLDFGSE